jgi:hypothetical protein
MRLGAWGFALLLGCCAASAAADEAAGIFKVVHGSVSVERQGQTLPATVGMAVYQSDRILTGADGSAGLTFEDNSMLSLGPSSKLAVDRFAFNSTTHDGAFETTLSNGRLAVISGKIAHHQLDAMKVRTPSSILGVRGTKFLVEVSGS